MIIGVISERLAEADCQNGFILDGVPRTIPQAEALEKAGISFDAVVSIEISDEEIVERMAGRRVCTACGAPLPREEHAPPKWKACATRAAASWRPGQTISLRWSVTDRRSITKRPPR